MKKNIIITLLAAASLTSCGEYNKLLKSTDYEYKYEAAKNYFAKGQYNRSATLLNKALSKPVYPVKQKSYPVLPASLCCSGNTP